MIENFDSPIEHRSIMNIHTLEAGAIPILLGIFGYYVVGKLAYSSLMVMGDVFWVEISKLGIMLCTSLLGVYLKNREVVNSFFRRKKKKGKPHENR